MAGSMNLGDAMSGDVPVTEGPEGLSATEPDNPSDGKIERVEIEVADNGGFTVREYYKSAKPGGYSKPKVSSVSDIKGLDALLDECFGMSDAYDKKSSDGSDNSGE